MTNEEKIQQLLNSQTKENNYIAMCLMLEVMGYSFEEAFSKIQLCEEAICKYSIEIGSMRIYYTVEFRQAIDVPSHWGYINRYIYVDGVEDKSVQHEVYIDEQLAWEMCYYEEKKVEEMDLFEEELIAIVPIAKTIFKRIYNPE